MTLGGKRMKPLGPAQWAGIVLVVGSAALTACITAVSIASTDPQA